MLALKNREFDLVLYGASGFLGNYVLEQYFQSDFAQKYKFAVAGRNEKKLQKTLKEVGDLIDQDLNNVPIIIADASNPEQLNEMAKRTSVIMNVVGPFTVHGESMINAAVENGTGHVDISGEVKWLEKMQLLYNEKAKKTGAYIIGACAWISLPVDVGVSVLRKEFPGTVAYVETFADLKKPSNYATTYGIFQAILLGLTTKQDELEEIRRKLMPQKLVKYEAPKRSLVWHNDELNSYVMPFFAADPTVVTRSEYHKATIDKQHPIEIRSYSLTPSFIKSWLTLLQFGFLSFICKFKPILRFVEQNPEAISFGAFSSTGPKREHVKQSTFSIHIKGYGWKDVKEPQFNTKPDHRLTVCVDGPDAEVKGSAAFALASALTILEDDNLPKSGGVYTTAIAFENTKLIDRLAKFGITFQVIAEKVLPNKN